MKNFQKFLTLICMITCILGLTACGNKEEFVPKEKAEIDAACQMVYSLISQEYEPGALEQIDNYAWDEIETGWRQYGLKIESHILIKGIDSFALAQKDIGQITGIVNTTYGGDDEEVTANLVLDGDSHDAKIEVIFDKNLKVTSITTNVEYSGMEKAEKAVLNTLMGMGTVFIVLILIMFIISCFSFINKWEKAAADKKKAAEAPAEKAAPAPVVQAVQAVEEIPEADDTQLAAVIAAAIAASQGAVSTDGFVVRSIRKRR